MNLNIYNQQKGKIHNCFHRLSQVARYLENEVIYNSLAQSEQQLMDEKFHLVVVGEFSRGKSTFVNAMLGRRLLPSSKKPTTAIITKIIYNEKPKYTLYYRESGKRPKVISEEEFFKLTAPKEVNEFDRSLLEKMFKQQQNLDDIKYAEVGYPLEICRNNVEVVDTPGTNDLNTGRIEITYGYIDQADAVILILGAQQALTASEMAFLKERIIGNQIKDIFFVINYKDSLDGAEQEQQVLNFVRDNLQELANMPADLRLYLVSSLETLYYRRKQNGETLSANQMLKVPDSLEGTGFVELENDLERYLSDEKGKAKLKKYVARGEAAADRLQQDLSMRMELANHSADEIKAKLKKLEPELKQAKLETERTSEVIRDNLENVIGELENHCRIASNSIRQEAQKVVDNYDGDMSSAEVSEAIERAVTPVKKNLIDRVRQIEKQRIESELEVANERLRHVWSDINIQYNKGIDSFPIKIAYADVSIETINNSTNSSDGGNGLLGAFIGGVLGGFCGFGWLFGAAVGRWIGSKFSDDSNGREDIKRTLNVHYKDETDNLIKQVKENFTVCIDNVCREFEKSVNSRLNEMEDQLKIALEQKNSKEHDAGVEKQKLEEQQKKLHDIMAELNRIVVS